MLEPELASHTQNYSLLSFLISQVDCFLCQVMNGAILQQVFVVDYVVQPQMCGDCHRVEAKDFWKAVVQVRQKVMRER